MNKSDFIYAMKQAIHHEMPYVAVVVSVPNCTSPEIIVNPLENVPDKTIYYANAYDENMRLKANPSIRITSVYTGASLDEFIAGTYKEVSK